MHQSQVVPTGIRRHLEADEIIVTKTDLKGHITYANDVFLRMSAVAERDALGKPHNLIRHPDMPRCVFKLLWDTIKSGNEIFAFVLNLACDGAHYWVLAHVTPSVDTSGRIVAYHSNRRQPAETAVTAMAGIYSVLKAEEDRHSSPVDAIAAGSALLERTLAEAGMTYDEFVWAQISGRVAA